MLVTAHDAFLWNEGTWRGAWQKMGARPAVVDGPAVVSDAAVVLGHFDPNHFLGGRMTLDEAAARKVVATIAEALGQSVERAAWAIIAVWMACHVTRSIAPFLSTRTSVPKRSSMTSPARR